jgi:hypothetical protein
MFSSLPLRLFLGTAYAAKLGECGLMSFCFHLI